MKKYIAILCVFLCSLAIAGTAQANDVKEKLVKGKWVNYAEKYIANPTGKGEANTGRYKIYSFENDGTFGMDSLKQKFVGTWEVEGNTVILHFKDKELKQYVGSINPGAAQYNFDLKTVKLGKRVGTIDLEDGVISFEDGSGDAEHMSAALVGVMNFYEFSGVNNASWGNFIMIIVGLFFIFLAIKYEFEPLLLVPIGTGIIVGNIPFFQAENFNLQLGLYEPGSVLNILYSGVAKGWYPPLIFMGIGAMTDFSSLISKPKLMLLGAAAQFGIFLTFILAVYFGFNLQEAGAIGIIGGADGPTAIFMSSKLANGVNVLPNGEVVRNLIGPIAIAAYSYMALVPVIQPPVIKLLTTKKERKIRMKAPRAVTRVEKILFPIIGLLLTGFIAPTALPLLGMLFLGNLLKESTVTNRLANTASNALIDVITILLGLTVGASTQADIFLTSDSIIIFMLGALSFVIATASGIIFAKIMNWLSPKDNPINPMIGAAGVSAVPDSARVVQHMGLQEDPTNHLLMHAMAPNVSGVIGSAVAAGIMLSFLL
ncbi:oxaloacetate decarboxylase beta subunit [Balneicella halophila]|uniref:Oxaloacetate decarboxylase beta subunit n=2 Tax=Balneicella halophila TaxID=1537566 RepID=A0A7L4UQF8_BALHA|nr:oxaloacetate decarboxylase beta subunit [Balneicella halophila]